MKKSYIILIFLNFILLSIAKLIPESEKNDSEDSATKTLFTGGMKMKGPTKLRGRKKDKDGEVSFSGSSGKGPVDFSKKKGYEEQMALRSRYFKKSYRWRSFICSKR